MPEKGFLHNPEKLVPESVCLWTPPDEAVETPQGMLANLLELQKKATVDLGERHKSLADAMAANLRWGGAMTKLETDLRSVKEWDLGDKECFGLDSAGASPWIACVRAFAWRHGPQAWPLPGIGVFVALTACNDCEVGLATVPLEGALAQGIVAADLPKFFETSSGQKFVTEHSVLLPLRKGSVAWIPYGTLVYPAAFMEFDKAGEADKKKQLPLASVWCFNLFVDEWAQKVPASVWTAVEQWNSAHLSRQKGPLWTSRAEMVKEFCERVKNT